MKKLLILIVVLLVSAVSSNLVAQQLDPDQIVTSFIKAYAENDIDKCISLCDIDEFVANCDFKKHTKYIGFLALINPYTFFPKEYKMYNKLNRMKKTANIASAIQNITIDILLLTDNRTRSKPIGITSDEQLDSIYKSLNPEKLSEIKLLVINKPNYGNDTEKIKEIFISQARIDGADDKIERIALVKHKNNYFSFPFTLLKYGTKWKISSFDSLAFNMSGIKSTTEQEFNEQFR